MAKALSEVRALLRRSDARQNAILQASLDGIVIMDERGCFLEFNPAAEGMFGYRRADVLGQPIADFIIPERLRESHRLGMARYLETGVGKVLSQRLELPALKASGEEFAVELAIVPVATEGSPVFVGFLRDLTAQKQDEQRRKWLLDELAHRSRNFFTVVHAIISRTLSDARPTAEARAVLSRRINALARSHTALIDDPEGAALATIVTQEIEGFSNQVDAAGPPLKVNAKAAQTFALIVHELATNASKYGALSTDSGRVTVTWSVSAEGRLQFEWREAGGPKVKTPANTGFGSVVLEQLAASDLQGEVDLDYNANGLVYRLAAPVAATIS
jgi:PAS domain S-box-containing protein